MKIEQSLEFRNFSHTLPSDHKSGLSFSQLLANGRDVDSIRQERAFGFSETGILGAGRVVPRRTGPMSANSTLMRDRFTSPLKSEDQGISKSFFQTNIRGETITAQVYIGTKISNHIGLYSKASNYGRMRTLAAVQPKFGLYAPLTASFKIPDAVLSTCARAYIPSLISRCKSHKPPTKLSLIENGTSVSIHIRAKTEHLPSEDIYFSEFQAICWRFGVTLKAVTVISFFR
jgi:hypothetical protein